MKTKESNKSADILKDPEKFYELGIASMELPLPVYEDAIEQFESAIEIWKENPPNSLLHAMYFCECYEYLASCYENKGNYEQALKNQRAALALRENRGRLPYDPENMDKYNRSSIKTYCKTMAMIGRLHPANLEEFFRIYEIVIPVQSYLEPLFKDSPSKISAVDKDMLSLIAQSIKPGLKKQEIFEKFFPEFREMFFKKLMESKLSIDESGEIAAPLEGENYMLSTLSKNTDSFISNPPIWLKECFFKIYKDLKPLAQEQAMKSIGDYIEKRLKLEHITEAKDNERENPSTNPQTKKAKKLQETDSLVKS